MSPVADEQPLPEVAEWMGHAGSKATETVYFHLLRGAEERSKGAPARAVAQNLSEALRRVHAA